jgi:hypothetical protein
VSRIVFHDLFLQIETTPAIVFGKQDAGKIPAIRMTWEELMRRFAKIGKVVGVLVAATAVQLSAVTVVSADALAEMLEAEASKIDSGGRNDGAITEQQQLEFERELQVYRGTYEIYRRLPERSRDEVLEAYAAGASMERLRDMIVDRNLAQGQ